MRKFLLSILAVIILAPSTIKAQDYLFDSPDNAPYLGVRLGFDIVSLQSPSEVYGNRGGIEIGAVYNMPLWKNLYFEPGVSLFYNSATVNGVLNSFGSELQGICSGTLNNVGIRIPLNFGYHFDITDAIQIMPFTGPQINLNLSHSVNYATDEAVDKGLAQPRLHYNFIDLGWNFGVGVKFLRYYIGVSGQVGMSSFISQNAKDYTVTIPGLNEARTLPLHARRNLFQITLGYNF